VPFALLGEQGRAAVIATVIAAVSVGGLSVANAHSDTATTRTAAPAAGAQAAGHSPLDARRPTPSGSATPTPAFGATGTGSGVPAGMKPSAPAGTGQVEATEPAAAAGIAPASTGTAPAPAPPTGIAPATSTAPTASSSTAPAAPTGTGPAAPTGTAPAAPTGTGPAAPLGAAGAEPIAAAVPDLADDQIDTGGSALGFAPLQRKVKPRPTVAWVDPMPEGAVTSCFGPRWGRLHAGVDLAAPSGTPIRAVGAGTVVTAGLANGYGLAVLIEHGNGYLTHYGHMSALSVVAGQKVQAGDQIGLEGSTGHSTGPHLHFEVHEGAYKNPIEPTAWLHERGIDIPGCATLDEEAAG
jgi:murein DD-endopeptidase MepM/ murein hydrolase activator NlpD